MGYALFIQYFLVLAALVVSSWTTVEVAKELGHATTKQGVPSEHSGNVEPLELTHCFVESDPVDGDITAFMTSTEHDLWAERKNAIRATGLAQGLTQNGIRANILEAWLEWVPPHRVWCPVTGYGLIKAMIFLITYCVSNIDNYYIGQLLEMVKRVPVLFPL